MEDGVGDEECGEDIDRVVNVAHENYNAKENRGGNEKNP